MRTQRGERPRARRLRTLGAAALAVGLALLLTAPAHAASPKATPTPKASKSPKATQSPRPVPAPPTTPIPVGTPPNAVITVAPIVYAGIPVTLSGAASTPSVSEWEWDLNGDGRFEYDSTSSPWVSKAFTLGSHRVTLRVRNGTGLVSTATRTVTARLAPAAAARPAAPGRVTAKAGSTSVTVRWTAPAGEPVLAYRVTNVGDQSTDPLYVPVSEQRIATFPNLVPGNYVIRVTAVNAAGAGPSTTASTTVYPRGVASASPSQSASESPTGTPTGDASAAPDTTASPEADGSTGGGGPSTLSLVLVGAGIVLLLVAGAVAINSRRTQA